MSGPPRPPRRSWWRALAAAGGLLALLAGPGAAPVAAEPVAAQPVAAEPAPEAPPPRVSAQGAVLWEPDGDVLLYGLEERTGRPMASTTKIMTVLLALEAGTLDDTVTVSPRAAALGGATLGLAAGQQVPMESLVAGLLLRSGNDAALAVAEHVAGSEEAFVERMNARARALGLEATRFVNASGLTDDLAHHAAPLDLARLAHVAMQEPVFARYAGAASATVPGVGFMESRNLLLGRYPGATGVKTGFTTLAGNCLVASATRGERTLYAVVLGSEDSFADATALLDHGFEDFRRTVPLRAGAVAARYRWWDRDVALHASEPLAATVPAGARVRWRTVLEPRATRPVAAGAALGVAELVVDDRLVRTVSLESVAAVPAAEPPTPAAEVGAAVHEAVRALLRLEPVERRA